MSTEIKMPQLSDTMDQGTILTWLKKEGEEVERGDALAEVSTDKADLEIESFHEGTLLKILSPEGTTVKVGEIIAVIGEAGEKVDISAASAATPTPPAPAANQEEVSAPQTTPAKTETNNVPQVDSGSERVKISPLARNIANAHGVDVGTVPGTGEGGRIVKRDIEQVIGKPVSAGEVKSMPTPVTPAPQPAAVPAAPSPAPMITGGATQTEPLSKMRQAIADQMVKSTTTIPHFYVTGKLEVDALMSMRKSLKTLPQYEGLTVNHLMIKAAALALKAVPRINAAFKDGQLVQHHAANIGIVTALPDGLLIPVLKNADSLPLADLALEAGGLVQRARAGRPKPEDLVGGTFSISNIGAVPVESFTAIISPQQGAILAVSGIVEEPIVRGGKLEVGKVMRVTLSVDHRIIDGMVGGQFVAELKRIVEDPVLLLA